MNPSPISHSFEFLDADSWIITMEVARYHMVNVDGPCIVQSCFYGPRVPQDLFKLCQTCLHLQHLETEPWLHCDTFIYVYQSQYHKGCEILPSLHVWFSWTFSTALYQNPFIFFIRCSFALYLSAIFHWIDILDSMANFRYTGCSIFYGSISTSVLEISTCGLLQIVDEE